MVTPKSDSGPAQSAPTTLTAGVFGDRELGVYLGGIEPRTLRLWRRNRGLPYLRITGKVVRYRKSDIDRWLDSHSVQIRGGCR